MKRITSIALIAVASAGCLPRGAPPAGQLIVADRQASLGAMVPPNGDGVLRVVFFRPNATDSAGSDLYIVSVDPSGAISPERLLIRDVNTEDDLGCLWKVAPCSFDPQGKLSVYPNGPPPQPGTFVGNTVVDPVTGEVTVEKPFGCSPSGQRCFSLDATGSTGTVTEAGGHTTTIQLGTTTFGTAAENYFIGEDFYYLDPNQNLIDVPPSAVAQQVAAGVVYFQDWPTPDGPLLILTGASDDPSLQPLSMRDPITGAVTLLPFVGQGSLSFSSDYRWLLYSLHSFDDVTMTFASIYTLYDRSSGTAQVLGFADEFMQWRPGHDQLWISPPGSAATQSISILTPGSPIVTTVPGVRLQGFSQNGANWFSTTDDPNKANPTLQVGLADDPTGPRFPYTPPGTWIENQWDLPDGRLVVEDYTNDVQRADTMLIDPRTGERKLLAERGHVAALGQTRVMGMYHYTGGRGDLTTVDLDSGRSTILAPEFTVTAFAEPQGTDLLAPGARVVYQFQARTASPYDGLWLVNSP